MPSGLRSIWVGQVTSTQVFTITALSHHSNSRHSATANQQHSDAQSRRGSDASLSSRSYTQEQTVAGATYLRLLVVLLGILVTALAASGGLGPLPLDTASAATTVGAGERVVDVLLRVKADDEGGDVDDLLADADVPLADEDTGVVDRLGEAAGGQRGLRQSYASEHSW